MIALESGGKGFLHGSGVCGKYFEIKKTKGVGLRKHYNEEQNMKCCDA